MRSEQEILDTAHDSPPFSNGTEGYAWMENWCYRPCMNPAETAWRRYEEGKRKTPPKDYPGGCPLILAAMLGKTPLEWLEQPELDGAIVLGDQYHCIEFRPPDDGGGNDGPRRPRPRGGRRPSKNQLALFPQPEPHRRQFVTPRELVDA